MPPISEPSRFASSKSGAAVPLSVVIPTQNEELHIERCLASVRWAAQYFVVDSFSNDSTVQLAEAMGARAVQHEWEGYSAQKNWALDNLPFDFEWVLFLDADERVSPDLAAEITKLLATSPMHDAYYIGRRYYFLGKWLKHAWWYPDMSVRLFRRQAGRFDSRPVHERVIVRGSTGELRHDLIHENVKSLHEYLERHNRYSTLEASELFALRHRRTRMDFRSTFRGDWGQRRRALKERAWYRLPLFVRPWVRFLWIYIVQRGLLDGREGFLFALLASFQELAIDVKCLEIERAHQGPRPTLSGSVRAPSLGHER